VHQLQQRQKVEGCGGHYRHRMNHRRRCRSYLANVGRCVLASFALYDRSVPSDV
jgi:hypothetical protein